MEIFSLEKLFCTSGPCVPTFPCKSLEKRCQEKGVAKKDWKGALVLMCWRTIAIRSTVATQFKEFYFKNLL